MKITIAGQDYSAALDASLVLGIERSLNAPSICQFAISVPAGSALTVPARFQPVSIVSDPGTHLFTGYIAATPVPEYAGMGIAGIYYRYLVQALSDEVLLDQYLMGSSKGLAGITIGAIITSLTSKTGSAALSLGLLNLNSLVGYFDVLPGTNWSTSVGHAATMARASYRALNGAVSLQALQSTVHALDVSDGSWQPSGLSFSSGVKRAIANDFTVCGKHEPVAYATEYFAGDGITTKFYLAADPFIPSSAKRTVFSDLFNEATLNLTEWGNTGGNYFALGAGGLMFQGGSGIDGQNVVSRLDRVEIGGTLLLEAAGVKLSLGSSGVLAGLYDGGSALDSCVSGFKVSAAQVTGIISVQPVIEGLPAGSSYTLNASNLYTLRMRMHCPEMYRVGQVYRSFGDSGMIDAGGAVAMSPAKITMEIQEYVNGVGGMPVTLYEGSVSNFPSTCEVFAASSVNLIGSVRSVSMKNLGSAWVESTPPSGSAYTRRMGTTDQAGECYVESTGKLVFYTGYIPASGEQVTIRYRTVGRAVGRSVNTISQAALAAGGSPSELAWIGSVTSPEPRTSQDCRNAALVMQQAASGVSALWSGKFKGTHLNFSTDVWPGDALEIKAQSLGLDAQVVVRSVKLQYRATVQDVVEYEVRFANDWADDLAIKTSVTVPDDTWLPAVISPTFLANLSSLTVSAVSSSTITINTGVSAPTGGGFEIRRRDFAFQAGQDTDLVARTSAQSITIARESANDRFYIRMFDGVTPPNYSEFSAALFINLPYA